MKATGVPIGQASVNDDGVALTGSLKLTVIVAPTMTLVAPLAGVVEVTVGGVFTVKVATTSAASAVPAVVSVTCEATTVRVQVTPPGRFAPGWRTKGGGG